MSASFLPVGEQDAPFLRVPLGDDRKVTTVALDLVRAAAEYQARRRRGQDTAGLVTELSTRFKLDASLAEALLAGQVKAEIDEDQMVLCVPASGDVELLAQAPKCERRTDGASFHVAPDERARRMQSVMLFHAASRGAPGQSVATTVQLCELLRDLRHWCDEHMVDLYKALDQSYMAYVHDKNSGGSLFGDHH